MKAAPEISTYVLSLYSMLLLYSIHAPVLTNYRRGFWTLLLLFHKDVVAWCTLYWGQLSVVQICEGKEASILILKGTQYCSFFLLP